MKGIFGWILDLGCDKQIPPIIMITILINVGVLFVPGGLWIGLGVDVSKAWDSLNDLMKYQLSEINNKNAVYVFWNIVPVVFIVNSFVLITKYNLCGYDEYKARREKSMRSAGKVLGAMRWNLVIGCLVLSMGYFLALFYGREEPVILQEFTPIKNRFSLILIHGLVLLYLMPIVLAVLVTEVRAGLSYSGKLNRNK